MFSDWSNRNNLLDMVGSFGSKQLVARCEYSKRQRRAESNGERFLKLKIMMSFKR